MNLLIAGSLISAKALFCLSALFGATRIHSYTRMASLIRMQLSDLCMLREVGTFGEKKLKLKVSTFRCVHKSLNRVLIKEAILVKERIRVAPKSALRQNSALALIRLYPL